MSNDSSSLTRDYVFLKSHTFKYTKRDIFLFRMGLVYRVRFFPPERKQMGHLIRVLNPIILYYIFCILLLADKNCFPSYTCRTFFYFCQ